MAGDAPETFACRGCGKQYRWKPELAGRAVKCACGTVMTAPARPGSKNDDLYDLAPEPHGAGAASVKNAPTANAPQRPASVVPGPVLSYQRKSIAPAEDAYFPNKVTDLHMPLALLVAGIVIQFLAAWWHSPPWGGGPAQAMAEVGIKMLISTVLLLIAVFIAAKARGFSFGPFWGAVLKLSAISIAPSAAMTLLDPALRVLPVIGGLITWIVGFCLYFALLGAFFDLDQSDTWYCVAIIFIINVAVVIGVWILLGHIR